MTLSTLFLRPTPELRRSHPAPSTHVVAPGGTPRDSDSAPAAIPASVADSALLAIDEMLERLATVTNAGRQHLMEKIVNLMVRHPSVTAGAPFLASRIEDLRRQARKAAPDGDAFASATRTLLATARIAK
jgi:hypothetical protein